MFKFVFLVPLATYLTFFCRRWSSVVSRCISEPQQSGAKPSNSNKSATVSFETCALIWNKNKTLRVSWHLCSDDCHTFLFVSAQCTVSFSSWSGARGNLWSSPVSSSRETCRPSASTWSAAGCSRAKCSSCTPTARSAWTTAATRPASVSAETRATALWTWPCPSWGSATRTATTASFSSTGLPLKTNGYTDTLSSSSWWQLVSLSYLMSSHTFTCLLVQLSTTAKQEGQIHPKVDIWKVWEVLFPLH